MSHIFVSYSRADSDYARRLVDHLTRAGFNVWMDNRIDHGEDWWLTIVKALKHCAAFIVIMTPSSDESRWVQREVTIADNLGKPAFPLLLRGDLLESENWAIYVRTQYADVRDGSLPGENFLQQLAEVSPRGVVGTEVQNQPALRDEIAAQPLDDVRDDLKRLPEITVERTPEGDYRTGIRLPARTVNRVTLGLVGLLTLAGLFFVIARGLGVTPGATPTAGVGLSANQFNETPTPTAATATLTVTATATPTQAAPSSTPTPTVTPAAQAAAAECRAVGLIPNGHNVRATADLNAEPIASLGHWEQTGIAQVTTGEDGSQWAFLPNYGGWAQMAMLGLLGDCTAFGFAPDLYPAPLPYGGYYFARGYEAATGNQGWDLGAAVGTAVTSPGVTAYVTAAEYCQRCGEDGLSVIDAGLSISDPSVFNDPAWNYGLGHYVILQFANDALPASTRSSLARAGLGSAHLYCNYGRLLSFSIKAGETLPPSTVFASSGNSGNSTGAHLALDCRASTAEPDAFAWSSARTGMIDPGLLFSLAPLETDPVPVPDER